MKDLDDLFEDVETVAKETAPPEEEDSINWEKIGKEATLLFPEITKTEEGKTTAYKAKKLDDVSLEELIKWSKQVCGMDVDVAENLKKTIKEDERKTAIFHGTIAASTLFQIEIDKDVSKAIKEAGGLGEVIKIEKEKQ